MQGEQCYIVTKTLKYRAPADSKERAIEKVRWDENYWLVNGSKEYNADLEIDYFAKNLNQEGE